MLVLFRLEVGDSRFLRDRTERWDGAADIQQRFTERCLPSADVRHERDISDGLHTDVFHGLPPL
jgi:hypothetical protein